MESHSENIRVSDNEIHYIESTIINKEYPHQSEVFFKKY